MKMITRLHLVPMLGLCGGIIMLPLCTFSPW